MLDGKRRTLRELCSRRVMDKKIPRRAVLGVGYNKNNQRYLVKVKHFSIAVYLRVYFQQVCHL